MKLYLDHCGNVVTNKKAVPCPMDLLPGIYGLYDAAVKRYCYYRGKWFVSSAFYDWKWSVGEPEHFAGLKLISSDFHACELAYIDIEQNLLSK